MKTLFTDRNIVFIVYYLSFLNWVDRLDSFVQNNYQIVATVQNYMYGWIPDDTHINAWTSFISPTLMVVLLLALPFVRYQPVRVLWAFLSYLIEGFQFDYILGHSSHALVWIMVFFALLPGDLAKYDENSITLKRFLRWSQLQIFLIYGVSGIWKMISFIEGFSNENIAVGFDYIRYAMASEFLYSNRLYASAEWVSTQPLLCTLLSILVITAQTGSCIVAFFPRFYFFWGLLLSLFHIGTLITVSVFFYWSIPPIVLLLCLHPMKDFRIKELNCFANHKLQSKN